MKRLICTCSLAVSVVIGCVSASAEQTVKKPSGVFYEFDKTRDISGAIIDDNRIFLVLGVNSFNENNHRMILAVGKVGGSGGSGCKATSLVEADVHWREESCAKMKENGQNSYRIDINTRFTFRYVDFKNKEVVQYLKNEDFVKQRKQTLIVTMSGSNCSGEVVSRHYMALDSKSWTPARTGPFSCVAKN